MHPRFAQFPRSLAQQAERARFGDVPVLLVHPDWRTGAPVLVWFHGRTVSKELDPGRYLRLMRAGIASVAIDLPGHGERDGPVLHGPEHTVDVVSQAVSEVDAILKGLREGGSPRGDEGLGTLFDQSRMGLGGMSAGGMVALRRLCDPHPFRAALVEATSGRLAAMYFPGSDTRGSPWSVEHAREDVDAIDPSQHLETWQPIPVMAISSETDLVVPIETQRGFLDDLRARYRDAGADPGLVELVTYRDTGAPQEHAGFGKFGADAKDRATTFLAERLLPPT